MHLGALSKLKPVYNSGSSGYGSLGSNGSHEHLMSVASSSDSNGNNNEDTQKIHKINSSQDICKDGNVDRNYPYFDSRLKLESQKKSYREKSTDYYDHTKSIIHSFENYGIGTACQRSLVTKELTWEEQSVYSYQQISCLDNVIRYLESCCAADTLQKITHPTPNTDVALNTDICREKMNVDTTKASTERGQSKTHIGPAVLETSDTSSASAFVGACLTSLTLPGKPESVISFTSQCSFRSTIVHVGDKKTQPELEIIEDCLPEIKSTKNQTIVLQSNSSQKNKEKAIFKKLGLTKEILAVHTQKEEQSFLNKCKEIKRFHIFKCAYNCYFQKRPKGCPGERDMCGLQHGSGIAFSWKKIRKIKKSKPKRHKPHSSSDSITSGIKSLHRFLLLGPNNAAWSPSNTSQASYPTMPFPAVMPTCPLQVFPSKGITPVGPKGSLSYLNETLDSGEHCPLPLSEFVAPLVTPVVALVLPSYMCPQTNNSIPQASCPVPSGFSAQPSFSSEALLTTTPSCAASNMFPAEIAFSAQPFYNSVAGSKKNPVIDCQNELSHSCTPQSLGLQDQSSSPLFQSQSSSPLQPNLLQLEETPKMMGNGSAGIVGNYGTLTDGEITNKQLSRDDGERKASCTVDTPMEVHNSDAFSLSIDLLDILLQEDTNSGTGSASSGSSALAAAESLGSESNGCGVSGSGAGYSGTSHTSNYFGSGNSSENNHKTKCSQMEEEVQFIKCVFQDPLWLLMANADDTVMMTYQIPSRFMFIVKNINSLSYVQNEGEIHEMELNE